MDLLLCKKPTRYSYIHVLFIVTTKITQNNTQQTVFKFTKITRLQVALALRNNCMCTLEKTLTQYRKNYCYYYTECKNVLVSVNYLSIERWVFRKMSVAENWVNFTTFILYNPTRKINIIKTRRVNTMHLLRFFLRETEPVKWSFNFQTVLKQSESKWYNLFLSRTTLHIWTNTKLNF